MELQFVHFNNVYADLGAALLSEKSNAILVAAQLFSVDDTDVSGAINTIATSLDLSSATDIEVRLADLIDVQQTDGYYAYAGSLTRAECTPPVTWVVLGNVKKISANAMDKFLLLKSPNGRKISEFGNYRPLQSLGSRKVYGKGVTSSPCSSTAARELKFECPKENNTIQNTTGANLTVLENVTVLGVEKECGGTCVGLAIALAFAATALLILAAVYIYRNADFTAPHVETSSTSSSTPEKHAIEPKEISAEAAIVFENGHESEPEISAEIVMDTVEVIDRDIHLGVA